MTNGRISKKRSYLINLDGLIFKLNLFCEAWNACYFACVRLECMLFCLCAIGMQNIVCHINMLAFPIVDINALITDN
ncbi:MAG: hypothetical protein DRR16_27125 [Candidatus Parabeggiatoa sp. nov. 3]|nr:MAG: hypothetical protein DRR00_10175 [Gammaproteobacteria bacterium]RKZ68472.1 MAG: hypothetical protein DRQ99_03620 [Gammaproteobacteria bacterium]RKZ78711.1 MAG: hypothetical protein DRR16_27125 [Gammaproteobacteria bacterium]